MSIYKPFRAKKWIISMMLLASVIDVMAADGRVDFFQQMGKMYVVVAVVVTIFLGLSIYLYRIDRKIKSLEKRMPDEK